MNDTFMDSDGDVWHRCSQPGMVEFVGRLWRIGAAGRVEFTRPETGEWETDGALEHTNKCAREAIAALWPEAERPNSTAPSDVDAPTPRRIVQLTGIQHALTALCDDGSAWTIEIDGSTWLGSWARLPPIPQGDQ